MKFSSTNALTLGKVLQLIIKLSNGQFGSQSQLISKVFKSYHDRRTEENGDFQYLMASSIVSEIAHDLRPVPRRFYAHYTSDDGSILRHDLEIFFKQAICTERQREAYLRSLLNEVERCDNLLRGDRDYILQATTTANNPVCELWFRSLFVLIREPVTLLHAC